MMNGFENRVGSTTPEKEHHEPTINGIMLWLYFYSNPSTTGAVYPKIKAHKN
jgi:hypothetical protein